MIDGNDNILPGHRGLYLQLLRSASRSEGYTDAEARVSLLLDVDKSRSPGDAVQSQRRYAAIWGWSHKKVRLHWDEVWQDVARLATSNGRQFDRNLARQLPPEWLAWARAQAGAQEGHTEGTVGGTKTAPPVPETKDRGTRRAHGGHTSNHPTSQSQGDKPPLPPTGGGGRFGEWWDLYPKKRGRKPAEAKWKAKGLDAHADTLIADVLARIERDERWRRGFIPDPVTYLNQERWTDELSEPARAVNGRDAREAARNDPAGSNQRISAGVAAAFRN